MRRQWTAILIGSFLLGSLAVAVIFIVFFGQSGFWKKKETFVLYFQNSVSGLNEGAPVQFRGVRVGKVKDIRLVANPETMSVRVPVFIEINSERVDWLETGSSPQQLISSLVERGLRAQIELQSFITGQCMIELDFKPDAPKRTVKQKGRYPEIPTAPSRLQELSQTVERLPVDELVSKLTSAIEGIERTVNSPHIVNSIETLNTTLKDLRGFINELQARIPGLFDSVDTTLSATERFVKQTDGRLSGLSQQANATLRQLRSSFEQLEQTVNLRSGPAAGVLEGIGSALEKTRQTLDQAKRSMAALEGMAGESSNLRYQLSKALEEISAAARSVRSLANTLERRPESIFRGKGN